MKIKDECKELGYRSRKRLGAVVVIPYNILLIGHFLIFLKRIKDKVKRRSKKDSSTLFRG